MVVCHDLIGTLEERSLRSPHRSAFVFLDSGGNELACLSYADVHRIAAGIATELQARVHLGDRVVVSVTSPAPAVMTFLGCLYAGVLPVLTPAPRHRRDSGRLSRLEHVIATTQARRLYFAPESAEALEDAVIPLDCERILCGEDVSSFEDAPSFRAPGVVVRTWRRPPEMLGTPAYIQFTSGSTGSPRGIVISYGNIAANLDAIARVFGHHEDLRGFSWLPLHHDMGLVGHVLAPLFAGGLSVLAPPSLFSLHPVRWLECISKYQATDSGAPAFAYRHCSLYQGELPKDLDLSCWKNAYCGGETIPPDVLTQFAARFFRFGFQESSFLPCYGLAESTLLVAGGHLKKEVRLHHEDHRTTLAYPLVPEAGVRIVGPDERTELPEGQTGEIFISGPFAGTIYGSDPGTPAVVKTGDLGYVTGGRLVLSGRKDDLMIVRGVNYHPEDVESALAAVPELGAKGAAVCFSVPGPVTEEVVVLHEVRSTRSEDLPELAGRIETEVADRVGLTPSVVALVRYGSLIRSSSGKLARRANRQAWLDGSAHSTVIWRAGTENIERAARPRDVAVIGMACRFPGAPDLDSFWSLLAQGKDAVKEVPPDRWDWREFYTKQPAPGKMNTRWGGFLEDIYEFDAAFFGIPGEEALEMDPQQRLVLEVAWRALEHARVTREHLRGSNTGVFIGVSTTDYLHLTIKARDDLSGFSAWSGLGTAHSIVANRLSYLFDLRGPSVAVDTACSSSLTAIHMAVQSLRNGDCDLAIAGGVNAILSPGTTVALSQFDMMAPDGRCKVFDSHADGYVRSEGCGVVVLQRAADADEARVLAYVRGSALNQDGLSRGITAPNPDAQAKVIGKALNDAQCQASDITLVEAHGTGTAIGDPVEMQEIGRAYGVPSALGPCYVSAVKANIGHLESAAGVAGFIKAVLALRHREIPPQIQLNTLHRDICLDGSRLAIAGRRRPWKVPVSACRVAGVSSFGFGGANAHVILEEAGKANGKRTSEAFAEGPALLVLSASSENALYDLTGEYLSFLDGHNSVPVAALGRTQALTRTHFSHRTGLVAASPSELKNELQAFHESFPRKRSGNMVSGGMAFLFGGYGSQYGSMGRSLYGRFAAFRAAWDRCSRAFAEHDRRGRTLASFDVFFDDAALGDPIILPAAIFSFEYALSRLWCSWGIVPSIVAGHSLGEYAAACIAGCFEPEDALRLVVGRAELVLSLSRKGMMAAVAASEERTREFLAREGLAAISIAAINAPDSTVISGDVESMTQAMSGLQARALAVRPLRTPQGFHSSLLDGILDSFEEKAAAVACAAPVIPLISNVSGALQQGAPDAQYWRRHLREPVRFQSGMQAIAASGVRAALECGPGDGLTQLAIRCEPACAAVASATNPQYEVVSVLRAAGTLYSLGANLSWPELYSGVPCISADLPRHRFYPKHYRFSDGLPRDGSREWKDFPSTKLPGFYNVQWTVAEPVTTSGARVEEDLNQSWIVIGEGRGLAGALSSLLPRDRRRVFCISVDPAIKQGYRSTTDRAFGTTLFIVPPECSAELYTQVIGEITTRLSRADAHRWNIVCLGALACQPPQSTTVESLEHDQAACGTGDLLAIAQALARMVLVKRLWVVTTNAQPVQAQGGEAPIHIAQSPLWGFVQTLFLEHPDTRGALIDVSADQRPDEQAKLILETISNEDAERLVAFRSGKRYVPRLTSVTPSVQQPVHLERHATYLVTGGLGGLGLQSALWLAGHGAGHIVLLGRRSLPARETWHDLASNTDSGRKVETIRAIEAAGATVEIVNADVTDHSAIATLFEQIGNGSFPLRGIIHAAGVNWFARVTGMDRLQTLETLKIKISAAWNLHRLSRNLHLDFFLLYSSVSSLWGSVSLSHYTAANHFLDVLAWHRRQEGLPALSINWGPWSEVGMSSGFDEARSLQKLGFRLMSPVRALRGLENMMQSGQPQAVIADIDWKAFQPVINFSAAPSFFSQVSTAPMIGAGSQNDRAEAERIRRLPGDEARRELITVARRVLGEVLLLDADNEIDIQQRFNLMGMDSLTAIAFALRLEIFAGQRLPTTVAWNYPTLAAVAEYLYELIGAPDVTPSASAPGENVQREQMADPAVWFPSLSAGVPVTGPRLFCFPCAGAGASMYRDWPTALEGVCRSIPVQLPGREERLSEAPAKDMRRLASLLADALQAFHEGPFVFFGHSMGALLAFQLTCELLDRGMPAPSGLILSGCPVPGTRSSREPIAQLTDGLFRQRVTESFDVPTADPAIWQSLLPVLRADIAMMESFAPPERAVLDIPLTVFGGKSDVAAARDALLQWSRLTTADFFVRQFEGSHMFLHRNTSFLAALREACGRILTDAAKPAGPAGLFIPEKRTDSR